MASWSVTPRKSSGDTIGYAGIGLPAEFRFRYRETVGAEYEIQPSAGSNLSIDC